MRRRADVAGANPAPTARRRRAPPRVLTSPLPSLSIAFSRATMCSLPGLAPTARSHVLGEILRRCAILCVGAVEESLIVVGRARKASSFCPKGAGFVARPRASTTVVQVGLPTRSCTLAAGCARRTTRCSSLRKIAHKGSAARRPAARARRRTDRMCLAGRCPPNPRAQPVLHRAIAFRNRATLTQVYCARRASFRLDL